MDLDLDLRLDDVGPDRVRVTLRLGGRACAPIQGASLVLVDARGQALGPRRLVTVPDGPGPVCVAAELRADRPLPDDARVVVEVWTDADEVGASCPTCPRAEAPVTRPEPEGVVEGAVRSEDDLDPDAPTAEELVAALDLDADTAEWLEALLREG